MASGRISEMENQIGAGLIEEVIQVAEGELKLVDTMLESQVYVFCCSMLDTSLLSSWFDIGLTMHIDGRNWKKSRPKVNGNILRGISILWGHRNLRINEMRFVELYTLFRYVLWKPRWQPLSAILLPNIICTEKCRWSNSTQYISVLVCTYRFNEAGGLVASLYAFIYE